MTRLPRWCAVLTLAGAGLLALAPLESKAQKKKGGETSEDEAIVNVVADTVAAYKLVKFGRDNDAPEALITAADLLRQLSKVPMGAVTEKPTIEVENKGETPLDEVVKAPNLADEANALFDEAQAMGAKLKLDLGRLIKLSRERENYRAVVGGPRTVARRMGPGQAVEFRFQVVSHLPVAIGFQASGPMRVQAVRVDTHHTWFDQVTQHGFCQGHPGSGQKKQAPVVIRIQNVARQPAMFQLFVN